MIRALANAGVDEQDVNVGFVLPTDALAAFNAAKIEAWATFGIYQAFAEPGCTGVDQRRGHQQRTDVHYRLG
ncbi:hypothetical protein D3C73_1528060 [compost metagenome]